MDHEGNYFTTVQLKGVFFSNIPLDVNEGAKGNILLEVELNIPEDKLSDKYEMFEEEKPYREFLIPASVVNKNSTIKIIDRYCKK